MSAGDGIVHSEFNGSDTEPAHSIPDLDRAARRGPDAVISSVRAGARRKARAAARCWSAPDAVRLRTTVAPINQERRDLRHRDWARASRSRTSWHAGRHAWAQVVRGGVTSERCRARRRRRRRGERRERESGTCGTERHRRGAALRPGMSSRDDRHGRRRVLLAMRHYGDARADGGRGIGECPRADLACGACRTRRTLPLERLRVRG